MTAPRRRTRGLAAVLLALVAIFGRAQADDEVSPQAAEAARRVLIVLRILAYDKALADRAPGDEVTVVVVSTAGEAGRRERAWWQAGFAALPKVKVGGRAVRVIAADYDSDDAFDALLASKRPGAVIVADDVASELPGLRRITRARDALSFSRVEAKVQGGLGVGIVPDQERDEIVINLEAARAEGARFGAGLLQLARLVD